MSEHHNLRPDADVEVLRKWREEADEQDRNIARARRELRQKERRQVAETTAIAECAALRAELVALRGELEAQRQRDLSTVFEAVGEALGLQLKQLLDDIEKANHRLRKEIDDRVQAALDRLESRIGGASDPEKRGAFKFAGERTDVEELPAFLPRRARVTH
jgi:hypothetical protein